MNQAMTLPNVSTVALNSVDGILTMTLCTPRLTRLLRQS
jgi:hypothetical protein